MIEPDEQDITIADNLKPKPDIPKPVQKPLVQPSSDLRKEESAKEDRAEQIPHPALQEVQEPTPVVAAPAEPEESHAAPVKEAPAKAVEQPVVAPVKEVQEPIKPVAPPPTPVVAAPAEPEESHAAPVKEAPAKAVEQPIVAPVKEVQEPIKPVAPPPVPVVTAAAEPAEKHAAPVKEAPAKAAEQPVVSPAPKEVPQNIPPSVKTGEMKADQSLLKQSTKPVPVIPDLHDVEKEEKVKNGIDKAKETDLSAERTPVAPAITADKAREKAAEAPAKAVETKAAAIVNKKTISLSLLKRFGTDIDPIRISIPVGRPMIKITTPATKKVSSKVQEIGGRVKGNGITRVILSINDDSVTVPVENDKFHWEGAFIDGKNTISATAWDRNRYSATDQIIVEAMPARNGFALSLEEPGSGEVASPVITVKGRVGDSTVDTVRLIVNREAVEAAVENGSFEKMVLFQEGENSLQAEAVNSKGVSARSSVLKVMVTNRKAPDILVHLYWEDRDSELRAEVARKTRDSLDDEQGAVSAVEVSALMSAHEGYREKIFAIYEAKAGAYVLSVTGGKRTKCILSVTLPSQRKTRLFGPVQIGEEGTFIGRLLMPEGIYWDEDEWFTGKIENGDSISKYKSPEGMTWKEMK